MRKLLLMIAAICSNAVAEGEGKAFPMTEVGNIEIKTLPAGRVIESQGQDSYFNRSKDLFMPLFRYISRHDISMTTPVEAQIDPGKMVFWIADSEKSKASLNTDDVTVADVPPRTVASAGFRGGYSRDNFHSARELLLRWVESQPELGIVGVPYAVYWHGPMRPSFMKRFEVHVEVTQKPNAKI